MLNMNNPEKEGDGDDIYQVPKSGFQASQPPRQSLHVSEEMPPVLMPKTKSGGFKRTSSLLDRQIPNDAPVPAQRQSPLGRKNSSRDASISNVEVAPQTFSECPGVQNIACASESHLPAVTNESSDLNKCILPVNENDPKPLVAPVRQTQSPISKPRPVPKQRTKVPQTTSQNTMIPIPATQNSVSKSTTPNPVAISTTQNSTSAFTPKNLNLSSHSTFSAQPLTAEDEALHALPSKSVVNGENKSLGDSFSFPLDADTLESMLNDEVDKKYGLLSASETKDTSESSEVVLRNKVKYTESHIVNDFGIELDKQNGSSSVKENQSHGLLVAPSVFPPHAKPTLDLGSNLFCDSSSDDIPGSKNSCSVLEVKPAPDPAAIKPSINQKNLPFSSKALSLFDTTSKAEKHGKGNILLDISYFDPLSKSNLDKTDSSLKKLQQNTRISKSDSNFNAGEQSSDLNHVNTSHTPDIFDSTYATAEEVSETPEAYYSQIDRENKNTVAAKSLKLVSSRKSFHHPAPDAPPPPFPRQQNRIPPPKPPPVPPRPDNPAGPAHVLATSPAKENASVDSSPSSSSTDVFKDLPAISFSHSRNSDPFQDSNFDYECLKFNKAQMPEPSRSKVSPTKAKGFQNDKNVSAAAFDPRMDPECISKFVIPPPNFQDGAWKACDWDFSKDLNNSDNEGADIMENPSGEIPRDNPLRAFTGSQSTKNTRFGFLYKQGGYKANKGWKKRWVVFSGTNLSYYESNTSQFSKRIIPVRCMVSIDTDVKSTDKNSFKFKVVTSLKDRVFIFSAETLEDCLTWANILMAAITEYKKLFGVEQPPIKPDKEGFVKFSNMKKYYVTITGKTFSYYGSFEDYQMGSPVNEIDMKLTSVKVKENKKLQLWIHYGHIDLAFETDQEMQQWRMAMEDAVAEGLSDDTVLNKVYENMSNRNCADCGSENPQWASINLGIILCKNCAGVHRIFDYRISKIRSLRMDTRVWTPSLIKVMVTIGNANANAFWELELPAGAKIQTTESIDKRREFITNKYKNKKFCKMHPLAKSESALGEALLSAARNDNILEFMKILFSGADISFRKDGHGQTAYDISKEHGHTIITEFLYQNGGDSQSLEQCIKDDDQPREEIEQQGYLNKTGPKRKNFEKRWCILKQGTITYYLNEMNRTMKGSIYGKDMYMIQAVECDKSCFTFEISTSLRDNRIFTFSSDSKEDFEEWIRSFTKLMAPAAVVNHMGMSDIKMAGYAYMKESLNDEWYKTFFVFSWRGINYMNRDLRFDYLDLRKTSNIKEQDSVNSYQHHDECFVISSAGKSVYLQATLTRDTKKMCAAFREAVMNSGPTLNDQALTNENVPVIVDRCITHVHMHGLNEKGIYRTAGQNSRVQALLDELRKNPWASMNDYTVQDVANVLKRFLRELDDSVFERISYPSWIHMADGKDISSRLKGYKYFLERMPQVNFHTLKRIALHLIRVGQCEKVNSMSVTNLAACFAPSLMKAGSDELPVLDSDTSGKEISIMIDLMKYSDYFFNVNENEREIMNNILQAESEIQKKFSEKKKSIQESASADILTPVHVMSWQGQSVNVRVTNEITAKEAVGHLKRNKMAVDLPHYVLFEQLFKGSLERPLFPEDLVASITKRWMEWDSWIMEDSSVCLCVQGLDMLEKLNTNLNQNHVLQCMQHYCDSKPKSKFKRKIVGFQQSKLVVFHSREGTDEWNVEDITIYMGTMHKKPPPPSRYCLTFTVIGEKYTKPPFGHCLSFDTEDELYRWAAALYKAQHPTGLLTWVDD